MSLTWLCLLHYDYIIGVPMRRFAKSFTRGGFHIMLYLLVAEISLVSIAIADYTYYLVLYPRRNCYNLSKVKVVF